jgi:hypothetical protein
VDIRKMISIDTKVLNYS